MTKSFKFFLKKFIPIQRSSWGKVICICWIHFMFELCVWFCKDIEVNKSSWEKSLWVQSGCVSFQSMFILQAMGAIIFWRYLSILYIEEPFPIMIVSLVNFMKSRVIWEFGIWAWLRGFMFIGLVKVGNTCSLWGSLFSGLDSWIQWKGESTLIMCVHCSWAQLWLQCD